MQHILKIAPLKDWSFYDDGLLIISGPCSAESRTQVLKTVRELAQGPINLIRAGIWKPRTRPGCFEGTGNKGLKWLIEAGREVGLPVSVEVAFPSHVDAALRHGVDSIWIGARSTASPFVIQALADALEGTDIPVFVKNPICPELGLWLGALERLNRVGLTKLAAIHRGFATYEKTKHRYEPYWDIALSLRQACPELPILCDPSHISGVASLVPEVARQAVELGFNGLMIESHCCPREALSDAGQQLPPARTLNLIRELSSKQTSTHGSGPSVHNTTQPINDIV